MLPGVGHRLSNTQCLSQVLCFVWAKKDQVAVHLSISGIHVAKHQCTSSIYQLLIAADVQLRSLFFALISIKNAKGDAHTGADCLMGVWIIERGVVGIPPREGWIGRAVRDSKLVVRVRLLNRLECCLQIGAVIESDLTKCVQRL